MTAIFTALLGLIGGVIAGVFGRRAQNAQAGLSAAQAADTIQEAAVDLLGPLRDQVGQLKQEVETLRFQVQSLTSDLEHEREHRALAERERDRLMTLVGMEQLPPE